MRQFMMKDAYSFDIDAAGLDARTRNTMTPIAGFRRCGLK